MIAYLRGKFLTRSDEELVIDVNGVGYAVHATSSVLSNTPSVGAELSVLIYTDVKENSISLYGFFTQLEREVFLLLKKVSGIGSKSALNLVSGVGAEDLLKAIGSEDVSALTRVNGVGKKTAERVLVELREQVGELIPKVSQDVSPRERRSGVPTGPAGDAILALEKLGFNSDRARNAVSAALAGGEQLDSGEILRQALSQLG
jgi:holliday junction DNA helicase RuvA